MFFLHAFQLTIHISDENDNPPIFSQDIYTKTIPENVPLGYSVIQVNTSDADLGINADHTFTITGMSLSVYIVFKNPEFFVDFSTSSYNNFSIGSSSPRWCSCHTLYVSPRKRDTTLFWKMIPIHVIPPSLTRTKLSTVFGDGNNQATRYIRDRFFLDWRPLLVEQDVMLPFNKL